MSRIVHTYAGSIGTVDWTWTRNPAGQIATMSRDNDAYAWTGAYNVSRAYAANGLNQYLTVGGVSFGYDANGNLTSDGSNAYVYDVENRLVAASGAHNAGLAYDPLGRLWQVSAAGVTTTFLYDGNALVAEYNGATLLRRHVHNVGADVPLITYEGTGLTNPRWLHANHQGSIVAHSNASGATAAINAYDEWGIPNAANVGRFQYTGQAWLPELGMYHYKARIYSPTLGRFLQTDPIGYDAWGEASGPDPALPLCPARPITAGVHMFRALYDWTLRLAGHRHAVRYMAAVSFAESSFFPIPPDVMVVPMILARREQAWLIATVCTISSVLGGVLGYGIGYFLYDSVGLFLINLYGAHDATREFQLWYDQWGAAVILIKGFTPIPFKIVTIASGFFKYNFALFVLLAALTRGARFFLIAWLLKRYGEPMQAFIERRMNLVGWVFLTLLVGGFAAVALI